MEMPLFLSADEKTLFASMKPELIGEWKVEEETLSFEDTEERSKMRCSLLRLHDPALLKAKERIAVAHNEQEVLEVVKTLDFSSMGNRDFTRLLFALGPDALSGMISHLLATASSTDDVELAAALSGIRHLMIESLVEADF